MGLLGEYLKTARLPSEICVGDLELMRSAIGKGLGYRGAIAIELFVVG